MFGKSYGWLFLVAVSLVGSQASATPIFIDFTSDLWSGADGTASATNDYDGIGVTLTASGGLLTYNSDEAPASTSDTSALALGGDGIGIGDDEIGAGESLTVSFGSAVSVLSIEVLDAFAYAGEGYTADFGSAGSYIGEAQGVDAYGFFSASGLAFLNVESVIFQSVGGSLSDFALAGLWIDAGGVQPFSSGSLFSSAVTRVSEPAMPLMLLLGLGLVLAGRRGRALSFQRAC